MSRNRNWIWFFAVLTVLAIAAVGINLVYNVKQQLTPADLDAAIALWTAQGGTDYDLTVRQEVSSSASDQPTRSEFVTEVRRKTIVSVTLNGLPLEERLWSARDVSGWFASIERFMDIDTEPGAKKVFCRAEFDLKDGHPLRYVRRVAGTRERQELVFRMTPKAP